MKILSIAELMELPSPKYLIARMIPECSVVMLFGQPASGKSFVALDMALCIASGIPFHGHKIVQRPVLYVAAEGAIGLQKRIAAWQQEHPDTEPLIRFISGVLDLMDQAAVNALISEYKAHCAQTGEDDGIGLIILDTFARCTAGADENSSKDMGLAMQNVELLKIFTKATVMLVHHTVKNGANERGSSAIRGAMDVMIGCEPKKEGEKIKGLTLKCAKMKDEEPFADTHFRTCCVYLDSGKSSLVLVLGDAPSPQKKKIEREKRALDILRTFGSEGATNNQWLEAFEKEGLGARASFMRVLTSIKKCPEGRLREQKDGRETRYYAVEHPKLVSVSNQSQTSIMKPETGISSPPPLGGDTDTRDTEPKEPVPLCCPTQAGTSAPGKATSEATQRGPVERPPDTHAPEDPHQKRSHGAGNAPSQN